MSVIILGIIEHESAVYVENDETWYNSKPPNNVIVSFINIQFLTNGDSKPNYCKNTIR